MAETKDIIDALSDGDNLGAEEAFKDTINTKVGDALETKRKEVANSFVKTQVNQEEDTGDGEVRDWYIPFFEKDEHKKSREYKKLSPKMRTAVDDIFKVMDAKPSDFLNTFEKTIKQVSKKHRVREKDLMQYFEREVLSI